MRTIRTEESGVSEIVSVLLLLGILIGVYSIYVSVTVPGEFSSQEKEHMSKVQDSFLRLQRSVQEMDNGESRTITVPMSAGLVSGLFRGPSIGGKLVVVENRALYFEIQNAYYPSQIYVYENGAVILHQEHRSIMVSPPTIINVIPYGAGDNIMLYLQAIRLIGSGELVSTGTGTIIVSIENSTQSQTPPAPNVENVTIVIRSNYRDAWKDYFCKLIKDLRNNGIHAAADFENLRLTIHGKRTTPGNDIYLVRENKNVAISIY